MRTAFRAPVLTLALLAGAAAAAPAQAVQERVDLAVVERIRDEGLNRSRIPQLAGHLTDVIGPRLTGSPAMRQANDWTAEQLREWGVRDARVEPWGRFGRGWERVSYSGRILTPFVQPLHAHPVAWTGSTPGTVVGDALIVQAQTQQDLERYRGRLQGAVVLVEEPPRIGPDWERPPLRYAEEQLAARSFRSTATGTAAVPAEPHGHGSADEEGRGDDALAAALYELLLREEPAVILTPSHRPYGILRVHGVVAARGQTGLAPLPELTVSAEQYGQIWRNVQRGLTVRVEVNVENRFHEDDLQAYNTLGDIPGTDLAGEYVMLGAHLDSWHSGTGATDNAAGSVVMLEAMRILRAVGVEPRRTIRIALWSGEEQGLLGSRAWVQNNRDLWPAISAYLNLDNGTGRIRGIWNQSNERGDPDLRGHPAPVPRTSASSPSGTAIPAARTTSPSTADRDPGLQLHPGPHRVRHAHAPHLRRHLRAPGHRGPDAGGGRRRLHRLPPGDARRDDAPEARAAERLSPFRAGRRRRGGPERPGGSLFTPRLPGSAEG
jgi:carboxypeptidase Q